MNLSSSSPGPFSERKFSLPEWMAARWRWLFSWSGRISSASYLYAWLFYGACMGTLVFSGYWAAVNGSIHPRFMVTAEHGINLACLSAAMLVPCLGLVFAGSVILIWASSGRFPFTRLPWDVRRRAFIMCTDGRGLRREGMPPF